MPKIESRRDPKPKHSNWSSSDRRSRLPPDWEKRRKRVLKRDRSQCQWKFADGTKCGDHATDVDHINPGDDHSDKNLRSLCAPHHRQKSSSEGAAALQAKRNRISKRLRHDEDHPGLL